MTDILPAVTLHQKGVTRVSTHPVRYGQTRELKLRDFDVHVNGVKIGSISSFIHRKDLTPNARTRSDGVAHVVWYESSRAYGHQLTRLRRYEAVALVLDSAGYGLRASRELAFCARVGKPVAALATAAA